MRLRLNELLFFLLQPLQLFTCLLKSLDQLVIILSHHLVYLLCFNIDRYHLVEVFLLLETNGLKDIEVVVDDLVHVMLTS